MPEELDFLWLAAQIEAIRMNLTMIFSEDSKLKKETGNSQTYRMIQKTIQSDCERLNQVRSMLQKKDSEQALPEETY